MEGHQKMRRFPANNLAEPDQLVISELFFRAGESPGRVRKSRLSGAERKAIRFPLCICLCWLDGGGF
jgi:hypothetical protein